MSPGYPVGFLTLHIGHYNRVHGESDGGICVMIFFNECGGFVVSRGRGKELPDKQKSKDPHH